MRERKGVLENHELARLGDAALRFAIAGIVVLLIVLVGPFMGPAWFFFNGAGSIGYGFLVAGFILRLRRSRGLASD
ncbi:MAG: hypothetical protein M3Z14_04675 [Candidatus Eremiobacteraeota bacterium]|nr:hypothetical protein [Candidatus Eremiobacteraeota bacterium]